MNMKCTSSRLLSVMAAVFVISAAFVCIAADGSDADFTDFEETAYVKVSGGYEDIKALGEDLDLALYQFGMSFVLSINAGKYTTEMTAESASLEKSMCLSMKGDTLTQTSATKISISNMVSTTTMNDDVTNIISTDTNCGGLGALSQYLGTSLYEGDEIVCTASDSAISMKTSMSLGFIKAEGGFLISKVAVNGVVRADTVLEYAVTTGSETKNFTVDVGMDLGIEGSAEISYTSGEPEYGDKVMIVPNLKVSCKGCTLSFNGQKYELEDLDKTLIDKVIALLRPNSADSDSSYNPAIILDKLLSSDAPIWIDYIGALFVYQLPSDTEIAYSELLSGLTGSDEESVSTIEGLGGTLNRNPDDAKKFINSIGPGEKQKDDFLVYAGAAVVAAAIAIFLLLLVLRLFRKNNGTAR